MAAPGTLERAKAVIRAANPPPACRKGEISRAPKGAPIRTVPTGSKNAAASRRRSLYANPTARAPKGLPGKANNDPVPSDILKVAVTSADAAAHQGPSKTPATAFIRCWKGKTRAPPTGTAKADRSTPNAANSAARTSLRVRVADGWRGAGLVSVGPPPVSRAPKACRLSWQVPRPIPPARPGGEAQMSPGLTRRKPRSRRPARSKPWTRR